MCRSSWQQQAFCRLTTKIWTCQRYPRTTSDFCVTQFRKSTQMQKLVEKWATLQAKADRLKEELQALML